MEVWVTHSRETRPSISQRMIVVSREPVATHLLSAEQARHVIQASWPMVSSVLRSAAVLAIHPQP